MEFKSILLTDMMDNARMYELLAEHDFDIETVCNYVLPKQTGLENTLSFDEREKLGFLIDIILSGVADEEKLRDRRALLDAMHMQMDHTHSFMSADKLYRIAKQFLNPAVLEEGLWPPLRVPYKTLDGRHVGQLFIYIGHDDEGTMLTEGEVWRKTNLSLMMWTLLMCVYKKNRKVHGRITDIVNGVLTPLIDYGKIRRTFIFKDNGYITPVVEYKWDKGSTPMLSPKPFFDPKTCKDYDFYTRTLE